MPKKQPTKAAEPEQPADMPPMEQADLEVVDSKKFGITGMQKEVLANYLNIQQLNQFQLRAHLQMLAETAWGIKADQFTRFGLNLDQNEVVVEFLQPKKDGIEAAPPVPQN